MIKENIMIRLVKPQKAVGGLESAPMLIISHLVGGGKNHFQMPLSTTDFSKLAEWIESRKEKS